MPPFRRSVAPARVPFALMSDTTLEQIPFTFGLDFKAAEGSAFVTELQDGDLLIEGWGANLDIDREDEAFLDGAFSRSLKSFLAGNAPLCYHHKFDTVIGKVVDAEVVAGKGVKIRAVVDHQTESSPLRWIYDGIKRGRINGLSCGGIFKRVQTKSGPRIADVDLLEWSATPVPVGRGTTFSVIAGKALSGPDGEAVTNEEEEVVVVETPEANAEGQEETTERQGASEHECESCKEREAAEAAEREAAEAKEREEAEAAEETELDSETVELMRTLERLNGILENVSEVLDSRTTTPNEVREEAGLDGSTTSEKVGSGSITINLKAIDYATLLTEIEQSVTQEEAVKLFEEPLEGKAADHSSGGHAGLERSFRKNWVDKVGGFPKHNWIYRAAKHLHADAGMPIGQAIAVAVNAAKKLCATGDLNFPGKQSANPGSRAEACAAVAEWEAMKARSKSD